MIRGVYLNGFSDDISTCLDIRSRVYREDFSQEAGRDEKDRDAVHILLFDGEEKPVGTVRLNFSLDGPFDFGYLCVLKEARNDGIADFIMHMLFDKAALSGARAISSEDITHNVSYFDRYGFEIKDGRLFLDLKEYYAKHSCHGKIPEA